MDRFSTRLAATIVDDRHREALAARRRDTRPGGPIARVEWQSVTGFERIRRVLWATRGRAGALIVGVSRAVR